LQVLGVLREITWLETQYHDEVQVKDGWLTRLIVWTLSSTAKRNRQQLLAAAAEQQAAQDDDALDIEEDMVSVYIGPHSMVPSTEISSNTTSLSPNGSGVDHRASAEPAMESTLRLPLGGRCTQGSGGQARDVSDDAQIRTSSAGEVCSTGLDSYGAGGIVRLGGDVCDQPLPTPKLGACDESSQTTADSGDQELGGGLNAANVAQGPAEIVVGDSCLSRDDSTGTMCTAESSLQTLEDDVFASSSELYGVGIWVPGHSASEHDCAMR
jgi:hypothetical protein